MKMQSCFPGGLQGPQRDRAVRARRPYLSCAALALVGATSGCGGGGGGGSGGGASGGTTPSFAGETPVVEQHVDQADIDAGAIGPSTLIDRGRALFRASFNTLDGAGRPTSTGTGAPRPPRFAPENFNRVSGPEANACLDCHRMPFMGGGGDLSGNVFVLAEALPFVNFDEGEGDGFTEHFLDDVGIERATVGIFGAGFIELVAREMSFALQAQRDQALAQAAQLQAPVTVPLAAKGVDFGQLTAHPDGTLDTAAVDGVDADLIVKPFHQKGVVASLREFTNDALNQHHGMQTSERFGAGVDADGDGRSDELTAGDVTALTVFQATLPAPGRRIPAAPGGGPSADVLQGEQLFDQVGCTTCHVPFLVLDDPVFTEPGPFNPPGNLRPSDVSQPLSVDLLTEGPGPFLDAEPDGTVRVPAFTDLKRHDMGPLLDTDALEQDGVATSEFLTKRLWGMANEPPYLHHGRALSIRDAILLHGGEAAAAQQAFVALPAADQDRVLEFLLTLTTVHSGAPANTEFVPEDDTIGEEANFDLRVDQADIDAGLVTPDDLFLVGGILFDVSLNTLDGAGRPETAGDGQPRPRRDYPENTNRISGPDATRCFACHNVPRGTGGGGNVHSVPVLAEAFPFVNFDGQEGDGFQDLHLDDVGNERAPIGLFGSGFIELLAREMTVELQALRAQALAQAQASGQPSTLALDTKGVSFGSLTAFPDGSLDASGLEGVDADLVVKPFSQKGVVASLREFSIMAMNQHPGMQAVERFGLGTDPDGDGVVDELSIGEMTALAVYPTMLAVPGRLLPSDPQEQQVVQEGEVLFDSIGCTVCHVPELVLDDPVFTEPGPFNPPGTLTPADVPQPFGVDLTVEGRLPRLPKEPDGTVRVPAYTDLKRHDMGPELAEAHDQGGATKSEFLTKKLWGMANEPPYLHHGRALTITEAILMHGGEGQAARDAFAALPVDQRAAVVRFLKTLQLLPDGSDLIEFE